MWKAIVAAPILEYSPLLSDADLIEIIACGQVQEVLAAIARRRPVSEAVGDVLVQSLDVPAVAALLVNPDAKIRKETHGPDRRTGRRDQRLALAAGAARRSFGPRHPPHRRLCRRLHPGTAGGAQRSVAMPPASISTANCARGWRKPRSKPAARSAADRWPQANEGRPAGRGLSSNRRPRPASARLVILALAELANVSEQTVKKILTTGSAKPLVALVWHAHLSMRVAFKIQTFIMKLPAREVLPARGGVGFPAEQGRDALASRLFRHRRLKLA